MTAGRPPIKTPDIVDVEAALDTSRVSSAVVSMQDTSTKTQALAAQLNYEGSTEIAALEEGLRKNLRGVAAGIFEAGKQLLLLRERCPHGEFLERIARIGTHPRVAQNYMRIARKFSNTNSARIWEQLGITKLLELSVLDDEQVDDFANGESVLGVTYESADRMTVAELKKALKTAEESLEAERKRVQVRSARVSQLEDEVDRVKKLPPDEVLAGYQREATAMLNDTRGALIGKFSACVEAIDAHHAEHGGDSAVFLAGLVGQLQVDLNALRDRFGIPDVAPAMIPEWVNDPSFAALAKE